MSEFKDLPARDLKYTVEVGDIVQSGNPNGFLAPGARVKEHPEVEAEIARLGDAAKKCPRCRNWHSVQGNPMDCCDRCVFTVNSMLGYLVENNIWTQESADEWRELVQQSVNRWKAKS
jgi:hypothetical protein